MSKFITGKTKIYGVIGDPIGHSLSPRMFNTIFHETGLDCVYLPFQVKKNALSKAIGGIRALDIAGLNVTIPHKQAVIDLLDWVDTEAANIGAVNLITNENGIIKGYNTDAPGFISALLKDNIDLRRKEILVLGAGGVSKAVSFALAQNDARLMILDRNLGKARSCADSIRNIFKLDVQTDELNKTSICKAIQSAKIVVNTTSVGMFPDTEASLVTHEILNPDILVIDIIYNPLKTRLLREAEKAGCRIINGANMFAAQGALAFEKWTGLKAPIENMTRIVIEALERHEN